MIVSANKARVVQVCDFCEAEHEHRVADLVLGASARATGTIIFPRCDCGAVEQRIRTWDEHPAEHRGSVHDRQRRLVNGLAQLLRARGQSHPDCRAVHARETRGPPDLDELPDEGRAPLEIPRRPR